MKRQSDRWCMCSSSHRLLLYRLLIQQRQLTVLYGHSAAEVSLRRPSRSTLKLEEAFHVFIPADEWDERLANGMYAVDLGACPGGWTYQLVKRNMWVSSVDNGRWPRA